MKFARMVMEAEAPNLIGYETMDFNLAESSVRDRTLGELGIDLGDMALPYGHHFGEPKLRKLIAEQSGGNIAPEDVIVTAGAAGALFLMASCLLEPHDAITVGFPNYATNFETPLAIGCDVVYHIQRFEDDFRIDLAALRAQVTPDTKFVSLTVPHNPSCVVITEGELRQIIDIVEENDCYLLFDETYRDLTYGSALPVAATLSDRVVSIGSMSKTWGVPGIRIGWLTTRNRALIDILIAGKEQIGITGSVVDEEIAYQLLAQKQVLLPAIMAEVKAGLAMLADLVENTPRVEEVAIIAALPERQYAEFSPMRPAEEGRFGAAEVAALRAVTPLVSAIFAQHWQRVGPEVRGRGAPKAAAFARFGQGVLSPREAEVARLVLRGHSGHSIAAHLGISPTTEKSHRKNLYAKLGVATQFELFALFLAEI